MAGFQAPKMSVGKKQQSGKIMAEQTSRLIRIREKIGLSQAEIAAEFGVSRSALSYWESGKNPIPETALRLLEIYEEYLDNELALKRHETVVRNLATSWSKRLMLTFASGARKDNRKRIQNGLEKSLYSLFRHELSTHSVKRSLQASIFNRIVDVASRSKGLPMKLVQAMAFLNPGMNQEAREALEQIHRLQCPMAPTRVAKIFYEDFGRSPSKLFAEWSSKPFATASIGQVHMARLHSGEKVAVKVQYPDVQESLEKDLSSLGFFAELISVFHPEVRSTIEGLQQAILKEADYYREKKYLDIFHEMFKGSSNILIPKAYSQFCSHRILTMDYIEGQSIEDFKNAPEEERKAAAETMASFMTETAFIAGIMNTDTNPGNFIFCPGGKVGFIDFGRADKLKIDNLDRLLKSVIEKDTQTARQFLPEIFVLKKGAGSTSEFPFEQMWEFFQDQQSHLHQGPFRFTHEYIAKTLREGKKLPYRKDLQITIEAVWSLTTSMGLWNVLADLNVAVDYGKISLASLAKTHALSK